MVPSGLLFANETTQGESTPQVPQAPWWSWSNSRCDWTGYRAGKLRKANATHFAFLAFIERNFSIFLLSTLIWTWIHWLWCLCACSNGYFHCQSNYGHILSDYRKVFWSTVTRPWCFRSNMVYPKTFPKPAIHSWQILWVVLQMIHLPIKQLLSRRLVNRSAQWI